MPSKIQTVETELPGVKLFVPPAFKDNRGFLLEGYCEDTYRALGVEETFVQDNVTLSAKSVLRGLHYDMRMAKFVQVLRGKVYDVVVDMRENEPTYKKWQAFVLSSANRHQLYIPRGFAHGFLTLTNNVLFLYKMSVRWDLEHERRLNWKDPSVNIVWPPGGPYITSEKDSAP